MASATANAGHGQPLALEDRSPVFGCRKQPSMVDFPGRLAAIFWTTGCNFRCGFCHNYGSLGRRQPGLSWQRLEALCREFRDQWVDGIVISGGEPTLWPELGRCIDLFRSYGFAIKLDSNGSRPEVLADLMPRLDYVAMDIKCSLEHYEAFVAWKDSAAIRESVELIRAQAADYEFRTTLLPAFHTDEELRAMAALVAPARRYVLQPFLPREDLPDATLRTEARTSPGRLQQAAAIFASAAGEVIVRGA